MHYLASKGPISEEFANATFDQVTGPVNPILESKRRICFGAHESSDTGLYLDYEDPPSGGQLGQVIRIGVDFLEYVAPSFVDFLNMIADAPVYDDDPDFDPLAGKQ